MSAPREKKQISTENPTTEKALTPEEREAAAKRKSKQYLLIGIVVAVLCAALLFWDSGIIQRNSTALTIGDTDYSAAEVSYFYNIAKQEAMTYAQYGMNTYNLNQSPEEQFFLIDPMNSASQTWADYFEEQAILQLTDLTAAYDAAIEAGYSDEDVLETVDLQIKTLEANAKSSGYTSFEQMLTLSAGRLVTPKIYRDILIRNTVANNYMNDYQSSLEYTDEDLNNYYAENAKELDTVEYGYLYFRAKTVDETDADGNKIPEDLLALLKEEAMGEARAKAAMVSVLWSAMPAEERAAAIPELIAAHNPDTSSEVQAVSAGSLPSALSNWLLTEGRTTNEVGIADYTNYGTYAILFHDRYLDETPSVNVQHILIQAEMDEGATAPTEAQMAAAKAKAEELLAQWKSGAATEESFTALANEHSQDTRDESGALYTPGGKYENVYEGNFVTNFNNWLFHEEARSAGDSGIVENNGVSGYYGYHIIHFLGHNEGDFKWKATARQNLVNEALLIYQGELTASYTAAEKSGMKYIR